MNKSSIINTIQNKYIDDYLESSKKVNYTELTERQGLTTVFYKDLPNITQYGYPIASDYVAPDGKAYSVYEFDALPDNERVGCELRYYYLPHSHELYVGTTGSGKTTGCVEPQLRAISSQKNKPHLFLTDPKGELFNRNARHLQDQGYKLFVLNFKDLRRTDKWNPLLEVYDKKMKLKNLGNDCIMRTGLVSSDLSIFGNKEDFSPSGYIEYRGYAFANGTACDNYIHFEEDYIEAEVDNLVNQLANMMIDVQSSKDKSWEFGAQDLLKGLIHCMLEDALDEDSGFTRDMMTFRTLQQYYLALRTPIMGEDCSLNNHWLLEDKSAKTKALMATALDNAPNTMRSYCGVFDGAVKDWFQGHIFALTTDSTVNLEGIGDHPFAIFLITRDYEKSDFLIAGLFIDWVYRQMLERAEQSKSITRTLHFLLDEFGNIPAIKDMENKIATSRSRNIWFHLFVQSYKQIDFTYNAECSTIIRDNCNAQIFLGAQNIETKAIFSRECGKHYIPTLESKLSTSNNSIHEVPLIPVSHLDQIKSGQMYTKRLNMPVIMSQFIRSYICARQGTYKHFADANGLETCTPNKIEAYTSARFTYAKLAKKRDK